jgi:hypothetical protein
MVADDADAAAAKAGGREEQIGSQLDSGHGTHYWLSKVQSAPARYTGIMPNFFGRSCPWLALITVIGLLPSTAAAQEQRRNLTIPTIAASAAAAADWASTYHALKYYRVREQNPVLRPLQGSPGSLISLGSFIDAGGLSAWNMSVGRRNPRVAVAGLWVMTAFRAYLVFHNMRNMRLAERR